MLSADVDRVVVRPYDTTSLNEPLSPLPSTSLTRAHLSDAFAQSPDKGATLDLAHKGFTDVSGFGAEEPAAAGSEDPLQDESSVVRLALGFNRLTRLPMAFALLSRLRYLNLKSNSFTVFPDVLTVMPSLEILDISRNKLKRLPSQPGSLRTLRVLCLSRNKLSRLPSYFSSFWHLNILKTDHNPFEWPPRPYMERSGTIADAQAMKDWIRGLQKWMEEDNTRHAVHMKSQASPRGGRHLMHGWPRLTTTGEGDSEAGVSPHTRSFSMDSDFSVYSSTSPNGVSDFSLSTTSLPDRPPPLTILQGGPYSASASPSRSPDSYLPSPARSDMSISEDNTTVHDDRRPHTQHSRNASLSVGGRSRRPLSGKKSLPDLRTAKLHFGSEKPPDIPDHVPLHLRGLPRHRAQDDFAILSPSLMRQETRPAESRGNANARAQRSFPPDPAAISPTVVTRPGPSVEVERNSYFRRLSTLPTASISKTLPPALLCLIEAARSVLFAVCQVYQALEHYTIFVIDERLSSVLKKVLDPASTDMLQLIQSLDRFDVMSRKALPSPSVCRAVVESLRDIAAVFGKVLVVLSLQLKVLETQDDVRYLRQMVLVLYGATAEISYAWQAMAPHLDAVKPLLRERPPVAFAKPYLSSHSPPNTSATSTVHQDHDSSSFPGELNPPSLRTLSTRGWTPMIGKLHTTRRHAGSFSSRDVEIGKTLPSYEEQPSMFGILSGTASERGATPRIVKRQLTAAASAYAAGGVSQGSGSPLPPPPPIFAASGSRQGHSRQGSQTSFSASASSSSSPLMHGQGQSPIDGPPNSSKKLVDKEALDAMKVAVEAAPGVWEMMEAILADILETQAEVRETLTRAKAVTQRLRENIRAVHQGEATADRKTMRDDAHVFVKTVVQLSNVIRNHGAKHAAYPMLRSKMVTLTNSTEEFVILLHVSSFSPSATPRPYLSTLHGSDTAMAGGMLSPTSSSPDDNRLPHGLPLMRSTQPLTFKRKGASPAQIPPPFTNPHYPRLGSGLPREVSVTPG